MPRPRPPSGLVTGQRKFQLRSHYSPAPALATPPSSGPPPGPVSASDRLPSAPTFCTAPTAIGPVQPPPPRRCRFLSGELHKLQLVAHSMFRRSIGPRRPLSRDSALGLGRGQRRRAAQDWVVAQRGRAHAARSTAAGARGTATAASVASVASVPQSLQSPQTSQTRSPQAPPHRLEHPVPNPRPRPGLPPARPRARPLVSEWSRAGPGAGSTGGAGDPAGSWGQGQGVKPGSGSGLWSGSGPGGDWEAVAGAATSRGRQLWVGAHVSG